MSIFIYKKMVHQIKETMHSLKKTKSDERKSLEVISASKTFVSKVMLVSKGAITLQCAKSFSFVVFCKTRLPDNPIFNETSPMQLSDISREITITVK